MLISSCALCQAQSPPVIGELFSTEESVQGTALVAGTGMSVASGSQLSAGQSVASLILSRGGQIRICPRTSISVNSVPNNEGLLLALESGSEVGRDGSRVLLLEVAQHEFLGLDPKMA